MIAFIPLALPTHGEIEVDLNLTAIGSFSIRTSPRLQQIQSVKERSDSETAKSETVLALTLSIN